jgi:holo-[acyl-carrier protein] synthase
MKSVKLGQEQSPFQDRPDESQTVTSSIRVGVDVIAVREVEASVMRFGDRYLQRIFTDHEIECCGPPGRLFFERLAARWTAKEAAIKVLRVEGAQPPWRDFEVRKLEAGWCEMVVMGDAKRSAVEQGLLQPMSLSMTHDAGLAMAVVITCASDDGRPNDSGLTIAQEQALTGRSYETVC